MFEGNQTKGYRVYLDGNNLIGTASVKLPTIKYMTEKMSGAGILGEIDMPSDGVPESLEVEVKFRTLVSGMMGLLDINGKNLEFRGSVQGSDIATGKMVEKGIRIVVRGSPKQADLGTLETNKLMDSAFTIECVYIKIDSEDATLAEIDKLNSVFSLLGKDLLAAFKENLGIGSAVNSVASTGMNTLRNILGM